VVRAVEDAGPRGVGRALALEVGEEEEAVGAGGDGADVLLELVVVQPKSCARLRGEVTFMVQTRGARRRLLSQKAGDVAPGSMRAFRCRRRWWPEVAEAGGDAAGGGVAGADGAHHVVAAAGA